jgi:hypothetical protein
MAGKADQEVHNWGDNKSVGSSGGFGGRNRIRDIPQTGSTPGGGAKAGGSKNNADAMNGSYSPDKIAASGGIQLQDDLRKVGDSPKSSGGPFDPKMKTERQKLPSGQADPKRTKSNNQGPEGDFGGEPGQSGSRTTTPYISRF